MPRLIVDDSGKRKAFRVTQGRLTVGSGADAKLSLTSAGVEEHHATLLVTPEGVRVQVLAPVTLSGETVQGGEVELELGSKLSIGDASINVEADAPDASGAKAAPSGSRAKPKAAAGRAAPTKSGSRSGRPTSGRRGAEQADKPAAGRRRAGGRAAEKQGLPPAAKFGGVALAIAIGVLAFSKLGTSSAATNNINAAAISLENGNRDTARKQLDRVDRSELKGELRERFDELLSELEQREAFAAQASERMTAIRYIDEELKNLVDKQFKTEAQMQQKVRLLLDRIADFRAKYPSHGSEVWLSDTTYAADYGWVTEAEQQYGSLASTSEPYTLADAEFRAYFFLDAEPRRYNEVMPVVAAARQGTSDEMELELIGALESRLAEEQRAYADKRLGDARKFYEEQDVGRAARVLVTDMLTLTDGALIDRAAQVLVGFPEAATVLRGWRDGKGSLPDEFAQLQEVARIRDFVRVNLNDASEPSEG